MEGWRHAALERGSAVAGRGARLGSVVRSCVRVSASSERGSHGLDALASELRTSIDEKRSECAGPRAGSRHGAQKGRSRVAIA